MRSGSPCRIPVFKQRRRAPRRKRSAKPVLHCVQIPFTLVKDTSLAFAIGVGEMFSTAKALVASQVSMVPFAIAALIYWVFNFVVEMLLGAAEKRLDYYHD